MAFSASYIFQLIDRYSPKLDRIARGNKRFTRSIRQAQMKTKRFGDALKHTGSKMTGFNSIVGTAGAGMALRSIIGGAVKFESALNKVRSVTWASSEDMKSLRKESMRLGRTTQFTASQVAEGMTFLGMAGLKFRDIMKVIPGMLNLAAAGGMQLADASDVATNVLAQFKLPLEEIERVSNNLAYAAANSNTNVYQLSEALGNTGKMAQVAGLSIEETVAMLMFMAKSGIKGGEAGTQFMNMLRGIVKMAPQTQKALRKIGIKKRDILGPSGEIKNLTKFLTDLGEKGVTLGELFKMFDIRGAKAAVVLKDGGESLLEFKKNLTETEDAVGKMAGILMEGAPGAVLRFKSAFEGITLTMAASVLPAFADVLERLANFMSMLSSSHPNLLKFAMVALFLAASIGATIIPIGFMITSFGAISGALAGLMAPIGLVLGGVLALVFAFRGWYKAGHPIIQTLKDLGLTIVEQLKSFGVMLGMFGEATTATGALNSIFMGLGYTLQGILKIFQILIYGVSAFIKPIFSLIPAAIKLISGDFKGAIVELGKGGIGAITDIKKAFKVGKELFKVETWETPVARQERIETKNLGYGLSSIASEINGTIRIKTEPGTSVEESRLDAPLGGNLAFGGA
jgi:TP901 family phage tail tape measure protein